MPSIARTNRRLHFRWTASDAEWASYSFSSLRNLSKLRFDLSDNLFLRSPYEPRTWADSVGIPRFLACFPKDLPLDDGVYIDLQYVSDFMDEDTVGYVHPRLEIDAALLRFDNLKRVTLCESSRRCDYYEGEAREIGAEAFPRLWEAKQLVCLVEANKTRSWCM